MGLQYLKIITTSALLSLSLMTNSHAVVDKATEWLVQQQDAKTGAFHSKDWGESSRVLTLKAMQALQHGSLTSPAVNRGLSHLNQFPVNDLETEFLAQRIELNHSYGRTIQQDISALLARKNSDGSFGANAFNHTPHIFSAVSAVMALMPLSTVSLDNSIQYIVREQSKTGQWYMPLTTEEGAFFQTVLAVEALQANQSRYVLANALTKARHYLAVNLNEDSMESSILAQGLLRLLESSESTRRYKTLIDSLKKRQQDNGSFDNDVYLTAVMVQVLGRVKQLNPAI